MTKRQGVTATEVLVALSLIVLLAAIVIPAVQNARELSRRATCLNNLKQFGAAMLAFESRSARFPSGTDAHFELLPFMDQGVLHQRCMEAFKLADRRQMAPVLPDVSLPGFGCPSDPYVSPGTLPDQTSYRTNWGTELSFGGDGMTDRNALKFSEARDGLSNTCFMSERLVPIRQHLSSLSLSESATQHPRRYAWPTVTVVSDPISNSREIARNCQIASHRHPFGSSGRSWDDSTWIHMQSSHGYLHAIPPNGYSCMNGAIPGIGVFAASSMHPQTVNVCMADGSARAVDDSIDGGVWLALGTRAGREPTGSF